ncbi:MAG: lipopolysaccharide biosynthesis protein [Propionibacteriaceae bacterium]
MTTSTKTQTHDADVSATQEESANLSKRKAGGILAASVIAAVCSFVITVITARVLGVEQNKEFLVFWGVLFGIMGTVAGVQPEATRAVNVSSSMKEPTTGARVVPVALILGAVVALVLALSSPWWGARVLPQSGILGIAAVIFAALLHSGQMALSGSFGGAKEWGLYAALMGGEATLRLVIVALAIVVAPTLVGMEVATAIPAATWLLFLLIPGGRRLVRSRADRGVRQLIATDAQSMLSFFAWSLLVVGFPVMLDIAAPGADPAMLSVLIVGITLTRSPIMMPLQAFQGVLITRVAESKEGCLRAVVKLQGALLALGLVMAVCAALLGPWIVPLLYGPAYRISWWLIGSLMLATLPLAWLVLTGAVSVALSEHRAYSLGWAVAAVATFVVLLVFPASVPVRAVAALTLGPLTGVLIHLVAIRRVDRALAAATS